MKISQNGIDLIKQFEGCKLTAYQDIAGVWTIGYGHTQGVYPNQTITQQQADQCLVDDLGPAQGAVNELVTAGLNQNQFDALCSFVFNIGRSAFKTSTLLRMLNNGDYESACSQFARWDHANGEVVSGLQIRRAAEAKLFATPASNITSPEVTNVVPDRPPTRLHQTTTGKLQIGAIATGGSAAIIQGIQQAKPTLDAVQSVLSSTSGFPGWLKVASVVLVIAAIAFACGTLWHKHKDMNP